MIKFLHSADWHLGAPLPDAPEPVRQALRELPRRIARLCRREGCALVLLAGDLLDGSVSRQLCQEVAQALEEMAVPVFISPGNHDPLTSDSPWLTCSWPENVHIFREFSSVCVPELDCRIYGGPFTAMDSPALLKDFRANQTERYSIGLFHGDPTRADSPYNPITTAQIACSDLDYLALGHVHTQGRLSAGRTLCVWPGCPMGRGFDETGEKGVLIGTLGPTQVSFLPLDTPRYYDLEVSADGDPTASLAAALPAAESGDVYRVTLTGRCAPFSGEALVAQFSHIPHLTLCDRTQPPLDPWSAVGRDSLEGVLFGILKDRHDAGEPLALSAAELARQLLDGQEVAL